MRLLHAGPDPGGESLARSPPQPHAGRYRARHVGQSLPVWRLSGDCARGPAGRANAAGRLIMVRVVRTKVEYEGRTYEETVVVEGEEPQPLADADLHAIGQSTRRVDGLERVTGAARYTSDIQLAGMLYGAIARCPHPHARLRAIDVSAAESLPGVRAILTHQNAPPLAWHGKASRVFDTELRHEGDEVAAVAADDLETAERALRLIQVDYEVLPFVIDP